MNQDFTQILVPVVVVISLASVAIVKEVIKYKLKKEQIKADAMVKAEQVRAKNQFEIEKLMYDTPAKASRSGMVTEKDISADSDKYNNKVKN